MLLKQFQIKLEYICKKNESQQMIHSPIIRFYP